MRNHYQRCSNGTFNSIVANEPTAEISLDEEQKLYAQWVAAMSSNRSKLSRMETIEALLRRSVIAAEQTECTISLLACSGMWCMVFLGLLTSIVGVIVVKVW